MSNIPIRERNNIFEKIYQIVKTIPRGKVMTYGEIAQKIKNQNAKVKNTSQKLKITPRLVGVALHKNPDPVGVPCHRVVGKNGHLTGYVYGIDKKRELLEKEGIKFKDETHVVLNL